MQRMLSRKRRELGYELGTAELEIGVDPVGERREALAFETRRLPGDEGSAA